MARRVKSLHHNLQEGMNIVFHREHRSKKNRRQDNRFQKAVANEFKKKKLAILTKELERENFNQM